MLLVILTVEKLLVRFMKKICQKNKTKQKNQAKFSVEKVITKKHVKMSNGTLISWIDKKKMLLHEISYFPKLYTRSKNKIKAKFNLFNYATKTDLKEATGVDTSNLAAKSNLVSLKAEVKYLVKLKS